MNLFITGLKHSGKSTFAPMLAKRMSAVCADSDDLILSSLKLDSIREFYRNEGKERFMEEEARCVKSFCESHKDGFILSLGGGAADNTGLMDYMKSEGKIVYLVRDERILLERILKKGVPPFLDQNDISGSFHRIYTSRDAVYRKYASLIITLGEYGDKEETCDLILSCIKEAF